MGGTFLFTEKSLDELCFERSKENEISKEPLACVEIGKAGNDLIGADEPSLLDVSGDDHESTLREVNISGVRGGVVETEGFKLCCPSGRTRRDV